MALTRLGRHGQAPIETAILVLVAVAALRAMYAYIQRAYQSYVYANASAQGQQFHPDQAYSSRQQLVQFSTDQQIDVKVGQPGVDEPRGSCRDSQSDCLPSVPGGALPGRTLKTTVNVESNWQTDRDGNFDVR